MRKLKMYIAASLNGKIADKNGDVEWLDSIPNPDKLDYGYYDFYDSIDTTIQGNKTYNQIVGWGIDFPYPNKKNYVFTLNTDFENNDDVDFISEEHIEFVKQLKQQSGKDIWVIGGGQINTMLLNENLIDEIEVYTMPIILQEGIELFENLPNETELKLIESKPYSTGVVGLKYTVEIKD